MAGLQLDPWQALVLEHGLAEQPDGRWAAPTVGVCVPRQNGKGAILEARELAGLFLLGERLVIHSAHEFATSREALTRLEERIEDTPEFSRRVKTIKHAHGDEGVYLTNGQRVQFRTRTGGGGRGFSADCVILDEAMILPEKALGALRPTLSAMPNPQVWYTGSAVDQLVHEHGVVFTRVRERGLRGDPRIAWFEWAAGGLDQPDLGLLPQGFIDDPDRWVEANPALGVRINEDAIRDEIGDMDPRTFAVERLGVGDWPDTSVDGSAVFDLTRWRALVDAESVVVGRLVFAFDVTPDRSAASICAAGVRGDGLIHVEVVDSHPGTGWVAPRLAELRRRNRPAAVVCDGASPAASLAAGINGTLEVGAPEYVRACGVIFDLVAEAGVRHLGQPELEAAIRGAARRPLTDAWAWSRKSSTIDITPLVAATLAVWRAAQPQPSEFVF